jgi:outer membrane PBP1 activator LpoA protein
MRLIRRRTAAQQAVAEGAETIVGPLFAQSVSAVASGSRAIPIIAFSTDASVASHGVYLLSFLPESDVRRIVEYAVSRGKRSFIALLPNNAYGTTREAALQQEAARRGARVVALEKYPPNAAGMAESSRRIAASINGADALFMLDGADALPQLRSSSLPPT